MTFKNNVPTIQGVRDSLDAFGTGDLTVSTLVLYCLIQLVVMQRKVTCRNSCQGVVSQTLVSTLKASIKQLMPSSCAFLHCNTNSCQHAGTVSDEQEFHQFTATVGNMARHQ